MSLNNTLHLLATTFVESILHELRNVSLDQLIAVPAPAQSNGKANGHIAVRETPASFPRATGRLKRRSLEEIHAAVARIVAILQHHPEGLRSESFKVALGLDTREVPRILHQGIADKQIKILSGQKRATLYGLVGAKKSSKKAPRKTKPARKAARKKVSRKKARK